MANTPHFLIVEPNLARSRAYGTMLLNDHKITGDRMFVFNNQRWVPNRDGIYAHLTECPDSSDIILLNTDILGTFEDNIPTMRARHPNIYVIGTRRLAEPAIIPYFQQGIVDAFNLTETVEQLSEMVGKRLTTSTSQP